MDIKKTFEKFKDQGSFIKVSSAAPVESSTKAALNRKGNQLFNDGKIEEARRIFLTTKYSDGLSRVGDYYKSKNQLIEALQMYWLAPDRTKSEPLIEQLSLVLRSLIDESDEIDNTAETEKNEDTVEESGSFIHDEQEQAVQGQNDE